VDLSPATLKMDFIHAQAHQLDSPPVLGFRTLQNRWIQDGRRAKALSFVPDNDRYLLTWSAPAADVNLFPGVLAVAVKHGIVQGRSQSDFNILGQSRNTIRLSDEVHELFDNRRESA
jgi:hypothetical protein